MPRLIVNADDLGYTEGINRAVRELAAAGAVTSATLMAGGDAVADAVVGQRSGFGIGCHLQFVEGAPSAAPSEVPSLLEGGASARFRPTLGGFVRAVMLGQVRDAELEREARAQIRSLQARGVKLTHIDTHKHTHIFPRVLRPVLRAALACGVPAIRNPFEPPWSRAATVRTGRVPWVRRVEVALLARLRVQFGRLVAEAGLRTTDGALSVLATGVLDRTVLGALLAEAERHEGTWELVCHPGYHDSALAAARTRLQGEREMERAALAEAAGWAPGLRRISFAEL